MMTSKQVEETFSKRCVSESISQTNTTPHYEKLRLQHAIESSPCALHQSIRPAFIATKICRHNKLVIQFSLPKKQMGNLMKEIFTVNHSNMQNIQRKHELVVSYKSLVCCLFFIIFLVGFYYRSFNASTQVHSMDPVVFF
jgi:hypothetical protein